MACNICLESGDIINTCDCSHQAHLGCIKQWHRNVDYGKIIRPNFLCCPQCKTQSKYIDNLKSDDIVNIINDKEWTYILCSSCKCVKQYMKESCNNYINTQYRLICNDCSVKIYKECPGCQILVEKNDGCAHMTCILCNTHYCWICLEIHNSDTIYNHIDEKHRNNTEHELIYQNYYDMIDNYTMIIVEVPEIYFTEELIELSFERLPISKIYFSEQSREMCLTLVKQDKHAFAFIKYPFNIDKEIYLEAVKFNGLMLKYIDEKFINRELCLIAVKQNGCAIKYVVKYFDDKDIYFEAIKQNPFALAYIEQQDRELCLFAVNLNSSVLQYVKNQDKEICLICVRKNGLSLQYIKEQDEEICLAAISKEEYAIQYILKQTKNICMAAVKKNPLILRCIHEQDRDICLTAVKINAFSLLHIKEEFYTDREIYFTAMKNNASVLQFIQNHPLSKDKEICLFAVNHNGYLLKYVENPDNDIYLAAVKQNGRALKYVKEQTEEICLTAVINNGMALEFVNEQTEEICLAAVNNNSMASKHINKNYN